MQEGIIVDGNKYVLRQNVRCYDVDAQMLLRPSSFMDYAQEMAYQAAEAMGFGYGKMLADGKAWVLSRLNFVFEQTPRWGDTICISTWHKGPSGPFYIRDFVITDPDSSAVLVRGTSSWVIMDIAARRMVRTSELMDMVAPHTQRSEDAIAENAARISMPRGVEPVTFGTHVVGYSDIDLQQHTNNSRYVLWATNCIDSDVVKAHPFRELTVNFNNETHPGDRIDLLVHEEENGLTFFVDGKCRGTQVFCVKLNLYE